jgi:hypothetical protein
MSHGGGSPPPSTSGPEPVADSRAAASAIAVPSTVVECLVRDEGVAGSNPATPTNT